MIVTSIKSMNIIMINKNNIFLYIIIYNTILIQINYTTSKSHWKQPLSQRFLADNIVRGPSGRQTGCVIGRQQSQNYVDVGLP